MSIKEKYMKNKYQKFLFLIICIFCSTQVSSQIDSLYQLKIPPRPSDAVSGSQFMESIASLSIETRETRVLEEISKGNIPNFLRNLTITICSYSNCQ